MRAREDACQEDKNELGSGSTVAGLSSKCCLEGSGISL
jgi:hypothetical protein